MSDSLPQLNKWGKYFNGIVPLEKKTLVGHRNVAVMVNLLD